MEYEKSIVEIIHPKGVDPKIILPTIGQFYFIDRYCEPREDSKALFVMEPIKQVEMTSALEKRIDELVVLLKMPKQTIIDKLL